MVTTAAKVKVDRGHHRSRALQLEYNWIKVSIAVQCRYRDDKVLPGAGGPLNEEYPRLMVYRGPRRKGALLPGRTHAWAIRNPGSDPRISGAPARPESSAAQPDRTSRVCWAISTKCSAPASAGSAPRTTNRIVADFCDFLSGRTDRFARDLERQMNRGRRPGFRAGGAVEDDLGALKRALEKQAVVLGMAPTPTWWLFADDDLEAAVQVFHVRGDGTRSARLDRRSQASGDSAEAALVRRFLTQFYGEQAG